MGHRKTMALVITRGYFRWQFFIGPWMTLDDPSAPPTPPSTAAFLATPRVVVARPWPLCTRPPIPWRRTGDRGRAGDWFYLRFSDPK